jgi:hypothetical protein
MGGRQFDGSLDPLPRRDRYESGTIRKLLTRAFSGIGGCWLRYLRESEEQVVSHRWVGRDDKGMAVFLPRMAVLKGS